MAQIEGRAALVTGANRGIGLEYVRELARRGAKVYAGARDPRSVAEAGAIPVQLDVTDPASLRAAAEQAGDVTVLVNNAGYLAQSDPLADPLDAARRQFEVNALGSWAATQAFAPVIAKNGGGGIVNMLSVASWSSGNPNLAGYTASKAAQWAITNSLRQILRPQGIGVVGVHVGLVDTEMADKTGISSSRTAPREVARAAIQGLADGADEVLVDERTRAVKASLSSAAPAYLAALEG